MRPGRRLGIDVGSVRIGVSACDPDGVLATPVETIPRDDSGAHLARLVELIGDHDAVEVVVGLPRHLNGSEGAAAESARLFAKELAGHIRPIPVRLLDERLTTVDAQRVVSTSGRGAREGRKIIDQIAAVLILQTALDLERSTGRPPGDTIGRKPRAKKESRS